MMINEIRIPGYFSTPSEKKMQRSDNYFHETGSFRSEIVVDSTGTLVDGYTSLLTAKAQGFEEVPVRVIEVHQVVKARHKKEGQAYVWRLPWSLIGKVSAGDKLIAETSRGLRKVLVESVEECENVMETAGKSAVKKHKKRRGRG